MTKQKIDFAKYTDAHNEARVELMDGTVLTVRDRIPFADKVAFARELAEQAVMVHDDAVVYVAHDERAMELMLIAKYYTDIDTDGAEPAAVADFLLNNDAVSRIDDVICDDLEETTRIFWRIFEMLQKTYERDASIGKALMKSFGFLADGKDITETMAEAEMTKDTLFEAFSAIQKNEKKITDGKGQVGGNIINFSAKKK